MSRPRAERVLLHVYEPAKQSGPSVPGFGVYHTGIELGDNGVEWCYAGGPEAPGSGVSHQRSKQSPDSSVWKYSTTIELGTTDKTAAQCSALIRDMQAEYAARDYDVIHHNCLAEGSLVSLANGTSVPIEEVEVGDAVLSYYRDTLASGQTQMEGLIGRQVDAVMRYGPKPCVELRFDDGRTLVCTPDHRIRTADCRWVSADKLVVGRDEVAVSVEYVHSTARGELLPLSHVQLVGRRDVGLRPVYDLSVPSPQGEEYRSFVANTVVCHNCNHFTADVAKRLGLKYPSHINRAASFGAFFLDNPIKDRQRKEAERKAEEERRRNVFANSTGHSLQSNNNATAATRPITSTAASPISATATQSSGSSSSSSGSSSSSSGGSTGSADKPSGGGAGRRPNPWADPSFFPGKAKPAGKPQAGQK